MRNLEIGISVYEFGGNRRLIAAYLILNPTLVKDINFVVTDEDESRQAFDVLSQYKVEMSENLLDTLVNIPVLEFHSAMYSLESASAESAESAEMMAKSNGAFRDEDALICPDCNRWEFSDEETICPECGHIFYEID